MLTSERQYGVEIECSACEGYDGDFRGICAFIDKHDGSVGAFGREFTSPPLKGEAGLDEVRKLCDYAERNGWMANERCGLHVHVDVRALDIKRLQAIACAFYLARDVFGSLVRSDRLRNQYCAGANENMADYLQKLDWHYFSECLDRYCWVNWAAYSKHGTVEVRLHHGTVEVEEICTWVELCVKFVDWAAKVGIAKVKQALWLKDSAERTEFVLSLVDDETAAYLVRKAKCLKW